jgi:succinyl-diaminopimelate desuccinylase
VSGLVDRTARYVGIPSVSGDERALADEVEGELREAAGLDVVRVGDNVVARTREGRPTRVVVAGHLDTVPGDQGVVVDGGRVTGLGACDMKGSLAVMAALAVAGLALAVDVSWVFYACEEVGRERSGLLEVLAARPELLEGDAAVVCEPTSARVEAGCQGVVRVRLTLRGERAHTARPWRGRNAIHRLHGPLADVAAYVPREVELDGVRFAEQLQAVAVSGGVAANVVPDRATLDVSLRVAPDRTAHEAAAELRDRLVSLVEPGDDVAVLDVADPAPPGLAHPVLARLVALTGAPPKAKLGWTDVATFSSRGTPAANFGAGDPELAHHAGEFVDESDLARCHEVLAALLQAPTAP